jgi:hypothetical protein
LAALSLAPYDLHVHQPHILLLLLLLLHLRL